MTELQDRLNAGVNFIPAVGCFFKREDKVLLGLRQKVSFGLGQDLLACIGGKQGDKYEYKDETAEECLVRECLEEINCRPTKYKRMGRVRFICPEKPNWQHDVTVFVVDAWEGEPQETAEKSILPLWFDINALPKDRMWADNALWVGKVLNGEEVHIVVLLDSECNVIDYMFE